MLPIMGNPALDFQSLTLSAESFLSLSNSVNFGHSCWFTRLLKVPVSTPCGVDKVFTKIVCLTYWLSKPHMSKILGSLSESSTSFLPNSSFIFIFKESTLFSVHGASITVLATFLTLPLISLFLDLLANCFCQLLLSEFNLLFSFNYIFCLQFFSLFTLFALVLFFSLIFCFVVSIFPLLYIFWKINTCMPFLGIFCCETYEVSDEFIKHLCAV